MKSLHKMLRVLEIVWLVVGIAGLGSSIYALVSGKKSQSIYFLAFALISGVMYIVRKGQRKRAEADAQKNPDK
jgi:hypothetical protein